jgi:hypothetical protein
MATETQGIKINKLDAARRQLRTAITLWFNGGDPVSAHALAYAAHDIVHAVSKKRNPTREALLFDAKFIREDRRNEFNIWLKRHANFFKHAEYDADSVIEFHPPLTELFILATVRGFSLCGENLEDDETLAFMLWFQIHKPHLLSNEGGVLLINQIPPQWLPDIRLIAKHEFLQAYKIAKATG